MLHNAQAEAEGIIRDLKELKKYAKDQSAQDKTVLEAKHKLQEGLDKMQDPLAKQEAGESKPLKEVKLGQTVSIPSLGLTGTVIALPNKAGEVQLQVGLMKMKQPLSALREAGSDEAPKKKEKAGKKVVSMVNRSVPLEIDVRGQLPEEAIDNVDKYLDDCMMAGLSEVSIVHGKGTGVLRAEITQHLRRHPHVAEFRLGRYGEGESGVTVVKLK